MGEQKSPIWESTCMNDDDTERDEEWDQGATKEWK